MRLPYYKLYARISDLREDSGFIRLYTEHARAVKETQQDLMERVRGQLGGAASF